MKETFSISRVRAIAKKEVMHIMRDPFTLGLALGIPVLLVVFFGLSINFDFKNIDISVMDFDHTRESRELVQAFTSSGYFRVHPAVSANPVAEVDSERSFAAIVINPEFAKDIFTGKGAEVQVLIDGTDNTKAGVVGGYIAGVQAEAIKKITGSSPQKDPIRLITRFQYNPELNTHWFIVPGLIVVVSGLLSILLTALTVAREWEYGSMELLLSTPVTPLELIMGKIAPYIVLGFSGIAVVYVIARTMFGVPFEGSYFLLAISCILFTTVSLAQGLLISVMAREQRKAMQFSMMMGLMPVFLLSGFIFPIESMPIFFRYFTMLLPARWFMDIIRGIVLKGSSLSDLAGPFVALVLMNTVLIFAAVKRFKRSID
ncbi:MAG: ABC transporter permease [Endomicrobiales bacterium]|jgi:ABC-2 type transport system permease protein